MLLLTDNTFDRHLQLCTRVPKHEFTDRSVRHFDSDGFELTKLEQAYYKANCIQLSDCLNHISDQKNWILCMDPNFILDHCLLLQRWEFVGDARNQITQYSKEYPQLTRFLKIAPKWGIDFALDYYKDGLALEVIHIEMDYRSYDRAMEAKRQLEHKFMQTDWADFVRSTMVRKHDWEHLAGFAQNDWKAVHWGLNRAEVTEKSYLV